MERLSSLLKENFTIGNFQSLDRTYHLVLDQGDFIVHETEYCQTK